MLITLDGHPLDSAPAGGQTLGELVEQVRRQHLDRRIIAAITIDGHPLVGAELDARLAQPVGPVQQLDLESTEVAPLCGAALRQAADTLADAGDQLGDIAAQLQGGHVPQAMTAIATVLGAWREAQQALSQSSLLLGRDLLAELRGGGGSTVEGDDHVDALRDKLEGLRDAFEARDMVLLADLVQFELPALTGPWCNLLTQIADRIETEQVAPTA